MRLKPKESQVNFFQRMTENSHHLCNCNVMQSSLLYRINFKYILHSLASSSTFVCLIQINIDICKVNDRLRQKSMPKTSDYRYDANM